MISMSLKWGKIHLKVISVINISQFEPQRLTQVGWVSEERA